MTDADDDLSALAAELESTLRKLRNAVDDGEVDADEEVASTGQEDRRPLRPPTFGELVRFTERYTIPTLIASLETTIEALRLFRGLLRLADPAGELPDREDDSSGPIPTSASDVAAETSRRATTELARRLRDLRSELSRGELPADETSRDLLSDARELTGELERRLDEATRPGESDRSATDSTGEAVTIDVTGGDTQGDSDGETVGDDAEAVDGDDAEAVDGDDAEAVDVDVASELRSIKDEVDPDPFHADDGDDGGETGGDTSEDEGDDPADR